MIAGRRLATVSLLAVAFVASSATVARAEHGEPHPPGIVRTARPADANLYVISPQDGETVSSPVTIRFGLAGMGVAPAGVATPDTGHHHLIIDAPLPPLDAPLPKDAKHLHFGGGQTEVSLALTPGQHTLQLVLGDKDHVPHEPPLFSAPITVTVK